MTLPVRFQNAESRFANENIMKLEIKARSSARNTPMLPRIVAIFAFAVGKLKLTCTKVIKMISASFTCAFICYFDLDPYLCFSLSLSLPPFLWFQANVQLVTLASLNSS